MKKTLVTALAGVAFAMIGAVSAHAQSKELTVYSTSDEAYLAEVIPAFQAKYPDMKLNIIRDSAGPIVARLLAEGANPLADAILVMTAENLSILESKGILQAYEPKGFEKLKPNMRDKKSPPFWAGNDAFAAAICFNTAEAEGQNIPAPEHWSDLTNPVYQGKIVMPDPGSSGTAVLLVVGWLEMMGEQKGWEFMDALDKNITQYVHGGNTPCRMAARGESVVGLSSPLGGVKEINAGAPLSLILPEEGNGAIVEGNAIVNGARNPENAKLFIDYMASEEAQTIAAKYYSVVAREGISNSIPNYPQGEEAKMLILDYAALAKNKSTILAEWNKRYGSKLAPRN